MKNIKSKIVSELQNLMTPNPVTSLDVAFDYLVSIMDETPAIDTLRTALETYYEGGKIDDFPLVRKNLATGLEHYIKRVLAYEGNEQSDFKDLLPLYKAIFNKFNWLSNAERNHFFSKDDSTKAPLANAKDFEGKFPNARHFKYAYDLRNALIHEGDSAPKRMLYGQSIDDKGIYVAHIQHLLITYLAIAQLYAPQIKKHFDAKTMPDTTLYLQGIIKKHQKQVNNTILVYLQDQAIKNPMHQAVEHLRQNRTYKHIALWGYAGLGKTNTFIYWLCQDAQERLRNEQAPIPVFISLGLIPPHISLIQTIAHEISVEPDKVKDIMSKGMLSLYLDGLNEVENQLQTQRIKEIDGLLKNYPQNFIAINSRPKEDNVFEKVKLLYMPPFNRSQMDDLVRKLNPDPQVKDRYNKICQDDNRAKMLQNPFLLSQLVSIVATDEQFDPYNEYDIIQRALDLLYSREAKEKKDSRFNYDYINTLLSKLAKELKNNNQGKLAKELTDNNQGISRAKLIDYFGETNKNYFAGNADVSYYINICLHFNILKENQNTYAFSSDLYYEHFFFM